MTTLYRYEKKNISKDQNKGKVALSLAIVFILVGLSVFYLTQINKLVAKNFELQAFQKVLAQNQGKNQALEVSLMQKRSLDNLQQAAKDLNLVVIDKANYLKAVPGFFALSD